jgi:hypothetical protein
MVTYISTYFEKFWGEESTTTIQIKSPKFCRKLDIY